MQLNDVPLSVCSGQRRGRGGQVLQRDEVHHQPAAGFQPGEDQADQFGEFAAGTAYEYGVRVRPAVEVLRRLAVEQRVVAGAEAKRVGARVGRVAFVLLDRPDVAVRREARDLKAYRAGAGADIPDRGVGRKAQLGER